MPRSWSPGARRAARANAELHGIRVLCLVCDREQRHYPTRGRRLRDSACELPACGAIALRSLYWVATHPELASEAKRRARAVDRVRHS